MILVSGATGFMGRSITRHLLAAGFEVRSLSRSVEKGRKRFEAYPDTAEALKDGRLTLVAADITASATLTAEVVSGVDMAIQCAQFPGAPVENPAKGYTYMNVDRNGTFNLVQALVEHLASARPGGDTAGAAPHFAYLSGVTVREDSTEFWNRAKWQAEQALRDSGLPWTVVRASWTYGPEDVSLNRILGYSDNLPFVPIFGDGEQKLNPLFVEDMGRFFSLIARNRDVAAGETIPLGGPSIVTMNQILRTALLVMGRRRPILHIPKPIGKVQGAILQRLPGRILSPGAVDFTSMGGVADMSLARRLFPDFAATPLRTALETYMGR